MDNTIWTKLADRPAMRSCAFLGLALTLAVAVMAPARAMADEAPLWLRQTAVSPDGATIAFAYGGQLYTVPAVGGTARLLTTSDVYATRPVWSPDGNTIAFAADRYGNFDVYAMPAAGGTAIRLTTHSGSEVPTGFSADGGFVMFEAVRLGDAAATYTLPSPDQHWQLYAIPATGGRELMVLPIVSHVAVEWRDGGRLLYEDQPGVEQPWRKHDMSSQTRDLWLYDMASGQHTKLTTFRGEDRNPVWAPDGQSFYYLSERAGSFNVWHQPFDPKADPQQITYHTQHPARFLSASDSGDLVYSYNGEIWRLTAGAEEPEKVAVSLSRDGIDRGPEYVTFEWGATEFDVSPSGFEIAFVVRGNVFVMSADGEVTKQITATPGLERSVSFSPDGRALVYASERDGSWGLYASALADDNELVFFNATLIEEVKLLDTPAEEYQPVFDPAGERIAYLENRETLRVLDLATGKLVTVMGDQYNYSYSDGDIWYSWSPDGRWLSASFAPDPNNPDIAIVDASGEMPPVDISQNGYLGFGSLWSADGRYVLWLSDSQGLRRSDDNPDQADIFISALTREAEDRLELSGLDYQLLKLKEEIAHQAETQRNAGAAVADASAVSPVHPAAEALALKELDGAAGRISRLTPFSADIGFFHLSRDGENLIYIVNGPGEGEFATATGYLLHHRTGEMAQLFSNLPVEEIDAQVSRDESTLYMLAPEGIYGISLSDGRRSDLYYEARMELDNFAEREAIFDHVWRLTADKFYRNDMNGVDWAFYGESYARFLPHITNGYDFAELLSEMVGELNNSHTGSGYRVAPGTGDATAVLGLFYALDYEGPGVMVAGVLPDGPADNAGSRIAPRVVIESVDGQAIGPDENLHPFLNHKSGRNVLVGLVDPVTGETWQEVLRPIGPGEETELVYWFWVAQRNEMVAELSDGRVGYVHIREMDDASYRNAYATVFGTAFDAEALLVDVRFNPGGNLTNQLLAMFGGELFQIWGPGDEGTLSPDPYNRWFKPLTVVINPAAYSDGYIFPRAINTLDMGPLVGEPVPGTGTGVWWETQQNPAYYYGLPQAGFKDIDGQWLEHLELHPDVEVAMPPEARIAGQDPQLEAAVLLLMDEAEH